MIDINGKGIKVGQTLIDKFGCKGEVIKDIGNRLVWDSVKGGRWLLMQMIVDLFEFRVVEETKGEE